MIGIHEFTGEDFEVLHQFEGWKIGFLRYSKRFSALNVMERHMRTDETFVLLEGEAVLYTEDDRIAMEKCKIYNIEKGVWHHITVSRDATVMVVENSETSKENTERKIIYADC